MIQNYFFLNRFIIEANDILKNSGIIEIFSQEKSKLIIVCGKNGEDIYLELCVIPGQSFINIRSKYSKAKKNTIDFFKDAAGQEINFLEIAEDDRIIRIACSHSILYFTIRGKYTNVFYIKEDDSIEAFKSVENEYLSKVKKEFLRKKFISTFNSPDLSLPSSKNYLIGIKKNYPIIGADIIKEVRARSDKNEEHHAILKHVLSEIKASKAALFINEQQSEIDVGFENFNSIPYTNLEIFDDIISAQNSYFSQKHFFRSKENKLKLIEKHIGKELKKLSHKINNLSGAVERGSKEEEYNKIGNQLLVNIKSLKTGMSEIEVEDLYSNGGKIKIKLNPKFSPKKNVDYYFDKSKAEKINFEKSRELLENAKQDYEKIKNIEDRLNKIDSLKELDIIMKELKIKKQVTKSGKENLKEKFKHYIIEDKYNVYVGKDSKNNDLLTTKFAKQNDYWFHARSVSGSHVVLRVENTKEAVPKSVLKKAAAIAAYHSKAKTAGTVPVAFTLKKYVVKKKGYPIGTVHLLKEDVLLVKPEISMGCEFVKTD